MQNLKDSGRPALEAESLKRHGIALARLGLYGDALSAFRRSVYLSKDTGLLNRAANAALAAFEELEERLAIKDAITLSGKPADEEVLLLEHELFKHALVKAQGKVTFAARSLGYCDDSRTHHTAAEAFLNLSVQTVGGLAHLFILTR